jgi:thymidylate synthase
MLAINTNNISLAWVAAVNNMFADRTDHISPLVISLSGFSESMLEEDMNIRAALDELLATENLDSVHTVANTIFPESLWRAAAGDRNLFFSRYIKALPRYRKLEPYKNGRGLYFERLIAHGRGPREGNQLEFILSSYRKGIVEMKLQASLFDPERDLTPAARIGFPCLQQVSFLPSKGGLSVNAFYATQLLVEKAYGNMLGLSRLGRFMASELGMELNEVNCYVGNEKLRGPKKRVQHIVDIAAEKLPAVRQLSSK